MKESVIESVFSKALGFILKLEVEEPMAKLVAEPVFIFRL